MTRAEGLDVQFQEFSETGAIGCQIVNQIKTGQVIKKIATKETAIAANSGRQTLLHKIFENFYHALNAGLAGFIQEVFFHKLLLA